MIYNYSLDDIVQDTVFENIKDFIEDLLDEYHKLHRYEILYIYTPSYIGKRILNIILKECRETFISDESDVDLLDEDTDIIISLSFDGMIIVESARWKSGVLKKDPDSALVYMYDTFEKKEVDMFDQNVISTLVFRIKDEPEECHCKDCTKKENTVKEVYKVNGCEYDKEAYGKILRIIDREYSSNLKNMLIKYCDVMDRINELYTLFW